MSQTNIWLTKTKPYEGILKEPMRADGGVVQVAERLGALFDHYELPRDFADLVNMMNLVLALSKDHVPGFQFESPAMPGRKATRVVTDIIILVGLKKAEHSGESINNAAQILAKRHPDWGLQASSIRQRYYRLKKAGPELERVLDLLRKL